ncbi:hypothetical protein CCACVL1_22542 [Corchorus capsularis]|uniref:Uncharacterized protein n=1 Tax=Corchorus capsularis TaxID=210143 RepID=A0A1R3GXZ8_COCAP|nr:hypothetical protein CCACVL1_22542 [Corchorus capsularis]
MDYTTGDEKDEAEIQKPYFDCRSRDEKEEAKSAFKEESLKIFPVLKLRIILKEGPWYVPVITFISCDDSAFVSTKQIEAPITVSISGIKT